MRVGEILSICVLFIVRACGNRKRCPLFIFGILFLSHDHREPFLWSNLRIIGKWVLCRGQQRRVVVKQQPKMTSSSIVPPSSAAATTTTRIGEQQRDYDDGTKRRYRVHRGVDYVTDALQLYRTIFHGQKDNSNEEEEEDNSTTSKYLDQNTWMERAQSGLLLLVTTTTTKTTSNQTTTITETTTTTLSSPDEHQQQDEEILPVGFCLSYLRPSKNRRVHQTDNDDNDDDPTTTPTTTTTNGHTWHIWLAGVLPDYRGQGIWTNMLLQETIQHATTVSTTTKDRVPVTIATIPKLYPSMYKSLLREGFRILREDEEGEERQ